MRWQCVVCERVKRSSVKPELCDCGALQTFLPVATEASAFKAAATISEEAQQRHPTGDRELDALMLGGIPNSARLLVWGRGGSGKSRCALRWATHIGPTACYSLEMPEDLCKRTAREAGGKLKRLRITRDELADVPSGARCVVYDSISEAQHPTEALERLKRWATKTGGIVFLVCHANKEGDYRGPSTLQHWPEAELELVGSLDNPGVTQVHVRKSRFCPKGSASAPLVALHAV